MASGSAYNPANALTFARVCRLIWETDEENIARISKEWGGRYRFIDLPKTDTQYLLFGNDRFTILAFRATQSKVGDIWTVLKYACYETVGEGSDYSEIPAGNAGFRKSAAHAFTGDVNRGRAAAGLAEEVTRFRSATNATRAPFFITGHSLGGGVALLTREKLEKAGIKADALYVYGCPVSVSPCESEAVPKYRQRYGATTFFHRHTGDNVPRLRPSSLTYCPPGVSKELLRDGTLRDYPCYNTMNIFTSIGWSIPWLTGIINAHSLEKSYIPALTTAASNDGPVSDQGTRRSVPEQR